jgi:hypothetical protein
MTIDYREVLKSDESLAIFLRNLARFDRQFTELIASGVDFTIRLEVHGNAGRLNHCRVYIDGFERPPGSNEADIGRKSKKQ